MLQLPELIQNLKRQVSQNTPSDEIDRQNMAQTEISVAQ